MTSFAFILGVRAAGDRQRARAAELRQALGTAVFFGMIGVTFFGLVFTPIFYVAAARWATGLRTAAPRRRRRPRCNPPNEEGRHDVRSQLSLTAAAALALAACAVGPGLCRAHASAAAAGAFIGRAIPPVATADAGRGRLVAALSGSGARSAGRRCAAPRTPTSASPSPISPAPAPLLREAGAERLPQT